MKKRVSFAEPLVTRLVVLPEEDRHSPWEIAARDRAWEFHKLKNEVERLLEGILLEKARRAHES